MGVLLEGIQTFIPGRYPGGLDIMLNLLGASISIIIYRIFLPGKVKINKVNF